MSIYGCTGPSRALPLTRQNLPAELRRAVRRLERIEPSRNLRLLLLVPVWAVAAAAALSASSLLIRIPATLVLGVLLVTVSVVMHEGCHRLIFPTRRANRLAATLLGFPILLSATAYRALHLRHHSFEHTERDPDDIDGLHRRGLPPVVIYYLVLLVGTYLYFPHVAREGWRAAHSAAERRAIAAEYAALILLLGLAWWLAPEPMLRLWFWPLVVAAQLTSLRSLAEHGLTSGDNPFVATRSVRTGRLLGFLICHLNLHLEHHLFPGVPWYNLPAVHRLVAPWARAAGASVYDGYGAFFRDFLRVTWSGVVPRMRLVPAHLREELCD